VESVILVGHAEVEETAKRRWTDIDVQAMALFLTGSGCRRSLTKIRRGPRAPSIKIQDEIYRFLCVVFRLPPESIKFSFTLESIYIP
jgi:hypothetical protein